jgi:DNA-binding winged helix-turn-helix (wHTH) protein
VSGGAESTSKALVYNPVAMRQAFGDCIFDRGRRELTCRGSIVHAGPKLLALLELLVDAAPRALTKEEIHKALWPDTFVSDATLTHLVAELRTALGDDARSPRLVKTIHGYGYAFVSEISEPLTANVTTVCSHRVIVGEREIPLGPAVHVIGRAPDAAIRVDDSGVSRQHARIRIAAGLATLEDLGSKNGTILDGETIQGVATLTDGSLIVLGTVGLKFRVIDPLASTDTVPTT